MAVVERGASFVWVVVYVVMVDVEQEGTCREIE